MQNMTSGEQWGRYVQPGKTCYGTGDKLLGQVQRVEGDQFWVDINGQETSFPLEAIQSADDSALHLDYSAGDLTARAH